MHAVAHSLRTLSVDPFGQHSQYSTCICVYMWSVSEKMKSGYIDIKL